MKAATIRDVAQHAQVSVASVSRVLTGAGAVTDETRQRVLQAIDALHYVPHSGARSLSTRRNDAIGVILPDLYGEFFSELIRGMDLAARERGLHLIVSSSHDDADEARSAMQAMHGRVDGLIILSPHLEDVAPAGKGPPVLTMHGGSHGPSIMVDNRGGAIEAVEHLIVGGRRRIAYIGGPKGNAEAEGRLAGYRTAVETAGLEPIMFDGNFDRPSGEAAGARIANVSPRIDAVFAASDMMAVGALKALLDAGLRVPEDVAVIGFDDVPLASLVRPSLSTMGIDIAAMGRRALVRVVALIEREEDVDRAIRETVRPMLVARQSTPAPIGEATGGKSPPQQNLREEFNV